MPDEHFPENDHPLAALDAWLEAYLSDADMPMRRPLPWSRLLAALMQKVPGEAATLMRYLPERHELMPLATFGLPAEVRGRRFRLSEQPRLKAITEHHGVCRFAMECDLPDPFDGLLGEAQEPGMNAGSAALGDPAAGDPAAGVPAAGNDMAKDHDLLVHDCAGIALRDGEILLGIMTFDALTPGVLEPLIQLEREDSKSRELTSLLSLPARCLMLVREQEATQAQGLVTRPQALSAVTLMSCPQRGPAMARLEAQLEAVADTEMTVLVQGETGVGKEGVVQRLHDASRRATKPLVRINCAALSPELVESALFGHRRGAFSGATHDHRGHFVMADGGTLLLDEIGELPLALQPKLLRVLQEGELQPLGSDRVVRVDVRVVAATNRDLEAEVAAGHFREDLYHRLSVYPLRVPPLRERGRADLLALAGTFLEHNRTRLGLGNLRLTPGAERALCDYPWPGNVRELDHCVSRAALHARLSQAPKSRADGRQLVVITPELLALEVASSPKGGESNAGQSLRSDMTSGEGASRGDHSQGMASDIVLDLNSVPGLRDATELFQREHIRRVWQACDGNWAEAARRLKMDRGNLYRQARRLGVI
ncbi:sigma 54-interacting transcriptional regulator [Cobetia sp. L2A1]|uniref:sigma 54-interacting transcriptional regulator n=1 Tax=Cobetia sp. L2A1 TaxID=2686360 RepID=UPI001E3A6550|nr:sigma 54-interacting transcriptional regulator [Cobetia sp. L2A1]